MRAILAVFLAFVLAPAMIEAQAVNNLFTNSADCVSALGKVPYYVPQFLGDSGRDRANGRDKIVAKLEGDACLHMVTMQGWKWAPTKSGTDLRWHVKDGIRSTTPYARNDCGNKVDGIAYPPQPVYADAPVEHVLPPSPTGSRLTVPSPPVNVTQTQTTTITIERGGSNTGLYALAVVAVAGMAYVALTRDGSDDDSEPAAPVVRVCDNPNAVNYQGSLPCRFPPGTDTDSVRVGPGTTTDSVVVELPTCNGLCGGIRTSRIATRPALVSSRSGASLSPIIDVRRMRATFTVSIPTKTVWDFLQSIAP